MRRRERGRWPPPHPESRSHWPMPDVEFIHGKVVDVRGRKIGADPDRRSRNQTVGLMERESAPRERASPAARTHAFRHPQGCETQPIEQPPGVDFLTRTQSAPDLLDGDDANPRLRPRAPETCHPSRGGTATKRIDQYRRVQQQAGHGQPDRWRSPRRCCRIHAAGSSSHSCPVSGRLPSAASISSQRRSSSSPRAISSATNALRLLAPARRSSSATSASSNAMCIRMG